MRICSECGLDMDLVGLRHRCVPLPRAAAVTKPVTKPIEEKPAVTKPNKGGRPRVGVEVMTVAERVARHRAKRRDGLVREGGYSRERR
jgi:hypothetical protein